MSLTTTAIATLFAALTISYAVGQVTSKEISTEIHIDAPTEIVWSHLTDLDAYREWNPFIKRIEGTLQSGEMLRVKIQPEGNAAMVFKPQVLKFEENDEFRWIGKLGVKGIFDGEHYFIVHPNDDGSTTFEHGEVFHGMLAGLFFRMIGEDTKRGFEAMNAALKLRAELE